MSLGQLLGVFGVIMAITLVAGALLSRRGERQAVPNWYGDLMDPEGPDSMLYDDEGDDLAGYRDFVNSGVDTSMPRPLIFLARFDDRSNAERFSADARELGFDVVVDTAEEEPGFWFGLASLVEKIQPHTLIGRVDAVRNATRTAGGVYLGYRIGEP